MQTSTLLSTLLTTATTVLATDYILAKPAPVLALRSTFQGGWPIEATTCPSNTTSCTTTGACCPNSTKCYTEGLSGDAVCCPNSDNCYSTATAVPICADPSWTLYIGNYDFYCCAPGQLAVLPNKADDPGAGLCVEKGSNVATTALATPYASASAAASAASAAESSSEATATASQGFAAGLVSSALGKVTGGAPSPTATSKSNAAGKGKGSSISFVGVVVGFVLLPFGM